MSGGKVPGIGGNTSFDSGNSGGATASEVVTEILKDVSNQSVPMARSDTLVDSGITIDPNTKDVSVLGAILAGDGALGLGEHVTISDSNESLTATLQNQLKELELIGVTFDDSGSNRPSYKKLTQRVPLAFGTTIDTPLTFHETDYTFTSDTFFHSLDIHPLAAGIVRFTLWLGNDDSTKPIVDEIRVIEAQDIAQVYNIKLRTPPFVNQGDNVFMRLQGDVAGGIARPNDVMAGKFVPYFVPHAHTWVETFLDNGFTDQPLHRDGNFIPKNGHRHYVNAFNNDLVVNLADPELTHFSICDFDFTWKNYKVRVDAGSDTLLFESKDSDREYRFIRDVDHWRIYSTDGFVMMLDATSPVGVIDRLIPVHVSASHHESIDFHNNTWHTSGGSGDGLFFSPNDVLLSTQMDGDGNRSNIQLHDVDGVYVSIFKSNKVMFANKDNTSLLNHPKAEGDSQSYVSLNSDGDVNTRFKRNYHVTKGTHNLITFTDTLWQLNSLDTSGALFNLLEHKDNHVFVNGETTGGKKASLALKANGDFTLASARGDVLSETPTGVKLQDTGYDSHFAVWTTGLVTVRVRSIDRLVLTVLESTLSQGNSAFHINNNKASVISDGTHILGHSDTHGTTVKNPGGSHRFSIHSDGKFEMGNKAGDKSNFGFSDNEMYLNMYQADGTRKPVMFIRDNKTEILGHNTAINGNISVLYSDGAQVELGAPTPNKATGNDAPNNPFGTDFAFLKGSADRVALYNYHFHEQITTGRMSAIVLDDLGDINFMSRGEWISLDDIQNMVSNVGNTGRHLGGDQNTIIDVITVSDNHVTLHGANGKAAYTALDTRDGITTISSEGQGSQESSMTFDNDGNIILRSGSDTLTFAQIKAGLGGGGSGGTPYDDTQVKQRITTLENATDNDTVYDDTALANRVTTLENAGGGGGGSAWDFKHTQDAAQTVIQMPSSSYTMLGMGDFSQSPTSPSTAKFTGMSVNNYADNERVAIYRAGNEKLRLTGTNSFFKTDTSGFEIQSKKTYLYHGHPSFSILDYDQDNADYRTMLSNAIMSSHSLHGSVRITAAGKILFRQGAVETTLDSLLGGGGSTNPATDVTDELGTDLLNWKTIHTKGVDFKDENRIELLDDETRIYGGADNSNRINLYSNAVSMYNFNNRRCIFYNVLQVSIGNKASYPDATELAISTETGVHEIEIRVNGADHLSFRENSVRLHKTITPLGSPMIGTDTNRFLAGYYKDLNARKFHITSDSSAEYAQLNMETSGDVYLNTSKVGGALIPFVNGGQNLGSTVYRFGKACIQSLDNSSDERLKSEIGVRDESMPYGFPTLWLDAWDSVQWGRYKKDSDKWDAGIIAQDIVKAFGKINVDVVKSTEWVNQDDKGFYSVDYIKLQAIENAYQRRRMDEIERKLKQMGL